MNQIFENNSQAVARRVQKSFKTTDLAFTMGMILIISSITGGIVSEAFEDPQVSTAKADVERIALATAVTPIDQQRGPASMNLSTNLTEISKDPWGHPYHVKMMKGLEGEVKVAVVSSGPNQKLESQVENFDPKHHLIEGDDIGYIYEGPNKNSQ